jgi:ribonuclease-3
LTDTLGELGRALGYAFSNAGLLQRALTHRSKSSNNNERLEFLGDSILSFVISAWLYERYPELTEGELTRVRASLVKQETLAGLARHLGLGRFLILGGGEYKSGGHDRDSILADTLEAIFGAIFLDGGIDAVRRSTLALYRDRFEAIDPHAIFKDPKTQLQEYLQKQAIKTPTYQVLTVSGEAHNQYFVVECAIPDLAVAVTGEGASRRSAEQQAAAKAFDLLMAR